MEYLIFAVGVVNLGALGWIALTLRAAAMMRHEALGQTLDRLERLADGLDAISKPSQRLRTDAQQPGDGIAALRERMQRRSH